MIAVEEFVLGSNNDFLIQTLFTNEMFCELKHELFSKGVLGLDEFETVWHKDFSKRKAIKEFLQDTTLGDKRLASMPDRITNTIMLRGGEKLTRPTVINAYDMPLNTVQEWWRAWVQFMFHTEIEILKANPQTRS